MKYERGRAMSEMRMYAVAKMASAITYYPELNSITGSVTSSILLSQLEYWFGKTKGKPFYKFLEPCINNPLYKKGDSWTEELHFSKAEFRTASKRICKVYKSKKEFADATDKFENKFYLAYTDKIKGLTYYCRNHRLLDSELLKWSQSENYESEFTEVNNLDLRKSTMSIYGDKENEFTEVNNVDLRELTISIYGDKESESPYTGDYIQEITTGDYIQETTQESTHKVACVQDKTKVPYQEVIDAYNQICVSLPAVQQLGDKRKRAVKKMWSFAKQDIELLKSLFTKTESSDFLAGRAKEWQANFDWIMRDSKAISILEGQYDNRGASGQHESNIYQSQGLQDFINGGQ